MSDVVGVVLVGGSRSLSASSLVSRVCVSLVRSGRSLAVGCAAGVDSSVLSWALSAGFVSSVACFAAFGPGGDSAAGAVSAVGLVSRFCSAGGPVSWWAGGGVSVPVRARLASRSRAAVSVASAAVFFVASPSSRGSLGAARVAASRGLPVVVFPVGFPGSALPLLVPGGCWRPSGRSGVWASAWYWVPPPSLF